MKQTNDNSEIGCRTIHMRQPIFAFQMDRVGRRSRLPVCGHVWVGSKEMSR